MKKYLLVIIMAIFTLCASAQGASPTKQEIDEQCSILQDNINLLRSKLVDIKTAEQNKVLEMKGEVSNDLLASNDSLIDKATRIVKKAKSCYEQGDTTSNNVPLVLGTVSEGLNAYVSVIFKKPNDIKNIDLKSQFISIFKIGSRYTLKDIKTIVKDTYSNLNISKTPKASDLESYFDVSEVKITDKTTGKRSKGYLILGIK